MDLTLKCSIWQRIFNVGTIHCCSGDKTTPEFDIKDIKNRHGKPCLRYYVSLRIKGYRRELFPS